MSERESEFLKSLKATLTIALGSSIVVIIGIVLTFYFTTNFKIGEHDKRLDSIEETTVPKVKYEGDQELQNHVDNQILITLDEIKTDVKELQKCVNSK